MRLRITNIRIIIIIIRSFRYNHPSYELYPSYDSFPGSVGSGTLSVVVVLTEGLVPIVVLSSVVVKEGLTPMVVLSVVVNEGEARPPEESRSGLSWVQRLQVKG